MKNEIKFFLSIKTITATFAAYAIMQSPYVYPENLDKAIMKFQARLEEICYRHIAIRNQWISGFISNNEWYNIIQSIILNPRFVEVHRWGIPKNGARSPFNFSSSYSVSMHQDPDDDSIDLYALANNIARDTWNRGVEEEYRDNGKETKIMIPEATKWLN